MTNDLSNDETQKLDPGIRRTVSWLRRHGFETTDSGDGISKMIDATPEDGVLNTPHVVMVIDPFRMEADSHRLLDLFDDHGVTLRVQGSKDDGVQILASYDPADRVAVLMLTGFNDEKLKQCCSSYDGGSCKHCMGIR